MKYTAPISQATFLFAIFFFKVNNFSLFAISVFHLTAGNLNNVKMRKFGPILGDLKGTYLIWLEPLDDLRIF